MFKNAKTSVSCQALQTAKNLIRLYDGTKKKNYLLISDVYIDSACFLPEVLYKAPDKIKHFADFKRF
jgi:hypothetical protein